MKEKTFIDTQILQNCWNFIRQQMKQFDVWFGLCGLSFLFGLLFSCTFVLVAVVAVWLLIIMSPIGLLGTIILAVAAGHPILAPLLALVLILGAGVLGLVLLSKVMLWGLGFFNAIAVNALDQAHGKPMRKFKNRVTGLIFFMGPVLYFLIICIGTAFFVIPGIIFGIRFSLARYVMLDQGGTVWEAFMTSWDMTRGHFWTLLLLYGISLVLYMIPFVFLIDMFFPFSNLCKASLYVQLQSRKLTPELVSV